MTGILTAEIDAVDDFKNSYTPDFLGRVTSVVQQGQTNTGDHAVSPHRLHLEYTTAGQLERLSRYGGQNGEGEKWG